VRAGGTGKRPGYWPPDPRPGEDSGAKAGQAPAKHSPGAFLHSKSAHAGALSQTEHNLI